MPLAHRLVLGGYRAVISRDKWNHRQKVCVRYNDWRECEWWREKSQVCGG